ncbi:hypothetical protein MBEHAL_0807 [Halarchaeum acidiphilum MH1-52-1]|uniref:Uncharacterized protein n=1 Tax=Halarchaeum acidiphilum MH1-52-1 TaxID=1261545 RepID=U2YTH0_9EURY|nr:hypothetical protein [Halarchaeum acidiphilum]GAD52047.1 hypothetical protein MBEHAL_0807 [Halarchaeum acidiphilum MH1-52-1]
MSDRGFNDDPDFTVARGVSVPVIVALRDYFAENPSERIEITRQDLESFAGISIAKPEAESIFTGLVLNGVAEQASRGRSFADYSFVVDCERAARVFEGQRIARAALEEVGVLERDTEADTELTATFPAGVDQSAMQSVRPLSSDLRRMMFDADTIVRIANPYFDPKTSAVGDIAGLANRGIDTRILTRETRSDDERLRAALNAIYDRIDPPNRHLLEVRDLYERDETGRQAYATHAKVTIADRDVCYVAVPT